MKLFPHNTVEAGLRILGNGLTNATAQNGPDSGGAVWLSDVLLGVDEGTVPLQVDLGRFGPDAESAGPEQARGSNRRRSRER